MFSSSTFYSSSVFFYFTLIFHFFLLTFFLNNEDLAGIATQWPSFASPCEPELTEPSPLAGLWPRSREPPCPLHFQEASLSREPVCQ